MTYICIFRNGLHFLKISLIKLFANVCINIQVLNHTIDNDKTVEFQAGYCFVFILLLYFGRL